MVGDQVMAFFGAPFRVHDHPRRAVRAALDIIAGVEAMADGDDSLHVGGGVGTGQMLMGNVGEGEVRDFTVIGDVVNTTARLQGAAAPGEVLVMEETYRSVATQFPDASQRTLDLRGKEGTQLVRVLRPNVARPEAGRLEPAPGPFRRRRWPIAGGGMAAVVAMILAVAGGIWFAQGGFRGGDDRAASVAGPSVGDTVAPDSTLVAIGLAPTTVSTPRSMYRGNLQHTGVYDTIGVPQLTGLKWRFKTGDKVYTSPAIGDGVVYFGSWDRHLYSVDIETGQEQWRFMTEGSVTSSAAIAGGVVFFGSQDGHVYAADTETGRKNGDSKLAAPCLLLLLSLVGWSISEVRTGMSMQWTSKRDG